MVPSRWRAGGSTGSTVIVRRPDGERYLGKDRHGARGQQSACNRREKMYNQPCIGVARTTTSREAGVEILGWPGEWPVACLGFGQAGWPTSSSRMGTNTF